MRRICTYLFISFAAIALMSCNATASAGLPQHTPTAIATPIPHFAVGQPATVGATWTITLTSAKVASGNGVASPTADQAYLVVALTFKNISSQTQTLSTAYSLTLTDDSGEQYNQTAVATLSAVPDGDIAAGNQVNGQLVYAISQTHHTYALAFQNDASLDGAVIWDFTA